MPGVIISSQRDKVLSDIMGREKHDRKRRQAEKEAQERELAKLIEKDGGKTIGAKAVAMARQALAAKQTPLGPKKSTSAKKGDALASIEPKGSDSRPRKQVFSATAVKRIGFNPSARPVSSDRHHDSDRVNQILQNLTGGKTNFKLGHLPGPRIRSGVFPPQPKLCEDEHQDQNQNLANSPGRADSDDDLWVV